MYAKAPILATDAISVLTICGAGKSKYLNLVYWIRNWNQSPRSHSGWDRRKFLHEWWADTENDSKARQFATELEQIYKKFTDSPTFSSSWALIIKSDETLQKRIPPVKAFIRTVGEIRAMKSLKYQIKSILIPRKLPPTIGLVSLHMREKGIFLPEKEIQSAAEIVASLLPYESW
jgi:hypothetical protein